jgi:hypothetical protein
MFFFDTFVRLFVGLMQSRIIFPSVKKYSHVSIYASRGGSWEKTSNDSRLTVITLNVVRHVPKASGPFLWELPAKASGVKVKSTWRVLRGIDPRLVTIKGLESFKGINHKMSWHQVWEKVVFFPSKDTYFLRKSVFFITEVTEEKKGCWKKIHKFVGSWCARCILCICIFIVFADNMY